MTTEISIAQIEEVLRKLPEAIQKAGQELVDAENKLNRSQNQLEIDRAKIRLEHIGEDLSAKQIESFAIVGTEESSKEVIELTKEAELKKLAKQLLEDKYISARKIANLKNIYQPL